MPQDLMYFRTKATPSMQENQIPLDLFRRVILWNNCERPFQILKQSFEGFLQSSSQKFTGKYQCGSLFLLKLEGIIYNAITLFTIKMKCCHERTKAWTSSTNLPLYRKPVQQNVQKNYKVFLIDLTYLR